MSLYAYAAFRDNEGKPEIFIKSPDGEEIVVEIHPLTATRLLCEIFEYVMAHRLGKIK